MSKSGLAWAAVCAALAVCFLWQEFTLWSAVREKERARADLSQQVEQLKAELQHVPAPAPAPAVRTEEPLRREKEEIERLTQEVADKEEALSKARDDLAALRAKASDLENTALTLRSQMAVQSQQSEQKLAAAESAHNQQVIGLQKSIERIQAALTKEKQRSAGLEMINSSLEAKLAAPAKPGRTELIAEFRELTERRESYLRSLASRYHEVTSQYRSMSGAIAGRQDQQSAPWNSAELSRIQSAISSADEDLRRLDELNNQAVQLEKKLRKP
jgi:chromosome segregation ATPase